MSPLSLDDFFSPPPAPGRADSRNATSSGVAAASERALAWARASAAEVKGLNATSLTT